MLVAVNYVTAITLATLNTLLRIFRRIGHPVDETMARSMKQFSESDTTVELWSARIPGFGRFAEHHWLVVWRGSSVARWEVWQTPDECVTSWGHLHCNLLRPSSGVGNGPGRLLHHWDGDDGLYLATRIESTPATYPWRHRYRVFPGPNSNTYVQWVLGSLYTLGWRGFGRRFAQPKSHHQSCALGKGFQYESCRRNTVAADRYFRVRLAAKGDRAGRPGRAKFSWNGVDSIRH